MVNPEFHVDVTKLNVYDFGNISISEDEDLEHAHEKLQNSIKDIISHCSVPFIIGGGNDQSFPNAMGLLKNAEEKSVVVVNIDAHLDVRPLKEGKVHSGSPFFLLLNSGWYHEKQY